MTAETITATRDKFAADPEAARSTPTVTGRLSEGKAELTSGGYTWHADLPPALGGTGSAQTPTQYILGALAGCAVVFIHDTLGPELGVQIDGVTAVARSKADARGLLGMEGAVPDLTDIEIEITIESPASQDRIDALERTWLERCPIYLAILKANAVSVTVTGGSSTG